LVAASAIVVCLDYDTAAYSNLREQRRRLEENKLLEVW
jgi:hypothetical protein